MFDSVLDYRQLLINLVITTVTRKPKKKSDMSPESYASKFAVEYLNNFQRDRDEIDPNASSCADNSRLTNFCWRKFYLPYEDCSRSIYKYCIFFSIGSTDQGMQKGAAFPFKSTPSGNLKVQSNQVTTSSHFFTFQSIHS